MPTRHLDYPVFDADNHMYETTDALTKFLPPEYKGVVQYVQVDGRTKVALKGQISNYIPNPTFNKVAPPGAMEIEFKLKNPSSKTSAEDLKLEPPPRYIEAPAAYFEPAPRLELMDELGLDRAMMWPTLASLIEERMADDPKATHAVVHALNQWMYESWSFNYENRIFATPIVTLPIVDRALEELAWVLEHGAKAILVRPAPVPDVDGRRRSFALEEFDPFWEAVQEADIVVGMHASDDGSQRFLNEWEGLRGDEFRAILRPPVGIREHHRSRSSRNPRRRRLHRRPWPCEPISPAQDRARREWKCLGAATRPGASASLRADTADVHGGSRGGTEAVRLRASLSRGGSPRAHRVGRGRQRRVRVRLSHPEGMYDPISFVDQLDSLSADDCRKVMGGNMSRLMKV